MPRSTRQRLARPAAVVLGLTLLASAAPTHAAKTDVVIPDRMEPMTDKFRRDTNGVGITEHLGNTIDLGLEFTDTGGRKVKLADYFKKGRPVVLQLGYFNCPQLCDVVSRRLMDGVKGLPLELSQDYSILYVSVDPDEEWQLAQSKKRTYVGEFGKAGAVEGWNFLVGTKTPIKQLADAVGFGYKKVEGRSDFSHPPMVVVLTGEGKISRYFYGFEYPSNLLQTSIDEAKDGKVGNYVQQILVALCYHYDEYSGKYSLAYMRMMQAGGLLTVLTVFSWLGTRWLRDARAARRTPATHA